jgi:16S rRNA processing protein RimM
MDVASSFMLGVLTRPHGYKGDLVLFVDADEPDRYGQLRVLFVETAAGLLPHFVRTQRPHGDRFVVHLEGIDDEAAALMLAGSKVWLPLEQLPPLGSDALYLHEAPGLEVWDMAGETWFGRVTRVLEHGPYPLLECDRDGIEVLIPLPAGMKLLIDRTARTLKLEVPEGLLDVFLHPGSPEEEES